MKVNRRTFLKMASAASSAALAGGPRRARAARPAPRSDEMLAMLVDTTRCVGCRSCEAACRKANQLPAPPAGRQPASDGKRTTSPENFTGHTLTAARLQLRANGNRTTDPDNFTVVNRYENPKKGQRPTFVKTQCMHCVDPACASACPVAALEKTPEGPVVYNPDRCIGCRYCMVACPFEVPKYEYEKAVPYVRKCSFCFSRVRQGQLPACASACPMKALTFGKRGELLEIAKTRIYQNPDRYVHHIYGEHEAGGTGVMYLSAVPFEQLGFPESIGTISHSQLASASLSAVPFILTLGPPFLLAIHAFAKNREETAGRESEEP